MFWFYPLFYASSPSDVISSSPLSRSLSASISSSESDGSSVSPIERPAPIATHGLAPAQRARVDEEQELAADVAGADVVDGWWRLRRLGALVGHFMFLTLPRIVAVRCALRAVVLSTGVCIQATKRRVTAPVARL